MSDITIDEFLKRLKSADQAALLATAKRALTLSLEAMVADTVKNRLSGQYLRVITGTARRSITAQTIETPEKLTGEFGSNLIYVRAHELGFKGSVAVREHRRRGATVRPHQRLINMRARRFLRDSLTAGLPALERRLGRALQHLILTGKVPASADLGA